MPTGITPGGSSSGERGNTGLAVPHPASARGRLNPLRRRISPPRPPHTRAPSRLPARACHDRHVPPARPVLRAVAHRGIPPRRPLGQRDAFAGLADADLMTHGYVVAESLAVARRRFGAQGAIALIDDVLPALDLVVALDHAPRRAADETCALGDGSRDARPGARSRSGPTGDTSPGSTLRTNLWVDAKGGCRVSQ
jgi:hypothetical protein